MRNRSQDRGAGRLLMEFNKHEEVPKLVTLREASRSKEARNRLLLQARTNHIQHSNNYEVTGLHNSLNEERKQKEQLQSLVRQLNFQLQKLKQVNNGLIVRLKEVQTSYRHLRNELELRQDEDRRKLKNSLYADIEEYIKMTVERLTLSLKQERMTPSLENKLERFLAELMEINSVSVQQIIRKSRIEPAVTNKVQQSGFPGESRVSSVGRYLTDFKARREELPSKEHYASIMQRLTGQASMSKSFAGAGLPYSSISKDARIQTVYATTPSKRKRIFE